MHPSPAVRRHPRTGVAFRSLALGAALTLVVAIPDAHAQGTAATASTTAVPSSPDQRVQAALAQLDALATATMTKSHLPGMAVAVVHHGATVYAKGFGVREVGKPGAVDADTVFQLASVSKSVGSTVIAREVTKGTVSWSTPVKKNSPTFAMKDPYVTNHATIADLYSHRSGLQEHAGDLLEDLGFSRAQTLAKMRLQPLRPFRAEYAYTNYGMTAAAVSVANAAHTDWATLSQRDIYAPLGMTRTSSRFTDYIHRPNHASDHILVHGSYAAKVVRDADPQSPAGGVSSSVNDMARWMSLVLGDGVYRGTRLISHDALQESVLPHMISSPAQSLDGRSGFYGYGFNIDTTPEAGTKISHSGAFSAGAATNYVLLPKYDVGIVVLTNAYPRGYAEALAAEFMDIVQNGTATIDWYAVYTHAFDSLTRPFGTLVGKQPPAHPNPARATTAYTGTYANAYYGQVKVFRSGSSLWLRIGPRGTTYRLRHWNGDVWTFVPTGESAMPGSVSKATFGAPGRGRLTRLILEYYDSNLDTLESNGLGRFRRV